MGAFVDFSGKRFGRLLVIRRAENGRCGGVRWECVCDCGNTTKSFRSGLASGITTSCGCKQKEHAKRLGEGKRTHGMSKSKEEYAWRHAIERCKNPKNCQFKNYGAKGIEVCERWMKFENFIEDMGLAPSSNHTLDRIDSNKGYSPENCRWATWKQQQRNRTNNRVLEIDGKKKSLAEWCEIFDFNYERALSRARNGWPVERIFDGRDFRRKRA